jgi:DnaA-homolog protein
MKQIALPLSSAQRPSFATFLEGDNAQALSALRCLLTGQFDGPLYLWGPQASGKTHLLSSARQQITANGHGVGWLGANDANRAWPSDLVFDPSWRLVVLDDVDGYSEEQQQQAFAWFIHAQSASCKVLAAGRYRPSELSLRDDLTSRLAWGQVHALQPLSEADCRLALQRSARVRGINLGDDIVDFVMRRFSRDLGSQMQLLDMLDRFALENKRAVTIPLITAMLRSL